MFTLSKKILNNLIPLFIILMVAMGVYLNALFNDFAYDDMEQILKHPWITEAQFLLQIFETDVWAFNENPMVSNYYRPMMHFFYLITYHIVGLAPWGFHLTNILLHAGNSALLFFIAIQFVNRQIAIIAALLFAVHPVHTEAVTWIAGIPELSFSLFYLFSFYIYIKQSAEKNYKAVIPVLLFFIALFCKETALTLPALFFIYDLSFGRIQNSSISGLARKYGGYIIAISIYFFFRLHALRGFAPSIVHHKLSQYEYIINVIPLFIQYLGKLLFPVNLNAFYLFHPVLSIFEWKWLSAFFVTVVFVCSICFSFR
jgi:hypothetical protein